MFLKSKEFGGILVYSEEPVPWSIVHAIILLVIVCSLYTAVVGKVWKLFSLF